MDFTVLYMSGAVYCMSDCIYFKVLHKIGYQYHLYITISENEKDHNYLFAWNNIPEDVMKIYEYVNNASFFGEKHILFGCNIARKNDNIYSLIKYPENPIGQDIIIHYSDLSEYNKNLFKRLWETLKKVKKNNNNVFSRM
jgi:hypothetical protein